MARTKHDTLTMLEYEKQCLEKGQKYITVTHIAVGSVAATRTKTN